MAARNTDLFVLAVIGIQAANIFILDLLIPLGIAIGVLYTGLVLLSALVIPALGAAGGLERHLSPDRPRLFPVSRPWHLGGPAEPGALPRDHLGGPPPRAAVQADQRPDQGLPPRKRNAAEGTSPSGEKQSASH